jgi:hypothetical protein
MHSPAGGPISALVAAPVLLGCPESPEYPAVPSPTEVLICPPEITRTR